MVDVFLKKRMENRGLRALRFLSLSSTLFVKKTGLKVVLNTQMGDGFLQRGWRIEV
jgi:hypothetical protein